MTAVFIPVPTVEIRSPKGTNGSEAPSVNGAATRPAIEMLSPVYSKKSPEALEPL